MSSKLKEVIQETPRSTVSELADAGDVADIVPELAELVRSGQTFFAKDLKRARSGRMTVEQLASAKRFLAEWRDA